MSKLVRLAILSALVFFVGAVFATPIRAAGRAECRSAPSKILGHDVPFCVLLPSSYDSDATQRYPVLYFLHGIGENEQVLLNSGGLLLVQDLRDQKQIGEFLIVTPAAGRSFYINSRDGHVRYEDFFIREFIPYIETHYRIKVGRRTRGISGVSMGGYGALRFALKYPQTFAAVSVNSAALLKELPKVKLSDSQETTLARVLGSSFGSPFDDDFWTRNNPFTLARNGPRPAGLKIYFDCGTEDDYGFNVGAQAFHDLLAARGIPNEFHLYPGGHDWTYFSQHFPAVLEFQSHAFDLAGQPK
jgi:S-formylglutathione hydrolase FrmB